MDKRPTIFEFLAQIFMIYGITMALLNVFCLLFGGAALGYSTIFSLGQKGLGVGTMLQFLLVTGIIVALRYLFMTDLLIKKMPVAFRVALLFLSVFAVVVAFVIMFGWFPVDEVLPWAMFLICFAVSCGLGVLISSLKEKQENQKLEEALKRMKEGERHL